MLERYGMHSIVRLQLPFERGPLLLKSPRVARGARPRMPKVYVEQVPLAQHPEQVVWQIAHHRAEDRSRFSL